MPQRLALAVLLCSAALGLCLDTASFYGASYIKYPLQDAKNTTEISFQFRTKRADTMLLLAAGKTDYCYIRLETGRLKVRINLGAGEAEVDSPRGLRLDDLVWHEVELTRKEADVTITIDHIHVIKEKLPGRFFELNIHFGVYLGGMGDFTDLFLGHTEWLRGCLGDVKYNGNSLLQKSRQRTSSQKVEVQVITWNCAPEFDASVDSDLSFVEDGAYVSLPNPITRTGARWQLQLKTEANQGLLLYNSGQGARADYVGLELSGGRLRLLLDKGDGKAELSSEVRVDDGQWHTVVAHFNPTAMEVTVDGQTVSARLDRGGNQYLDLHEVVYLGGTELSKRARALWQGLRDTSFRGCMRAVEVDGRRLGLPDARVTHGVRAECLFDFVCAAQQPCVRGARCEQQGLSAFQCVCDQPLCVRPEFADSYKVYSRGPMPVDVELVELTTLSVAEGENVPVTTSHVNVVLDYVKYGVRDTGVLIRVLQPPAHGKLIAEVWERGGGAPGLGAGSGTLFTLLDLAKDKVRYQHDGSESTRDQIVMELELQAGPDFVQPAHLQGPHRFALPVNITPVNDAPILSIPAGKTLRLAQGTRKVITPELLMADDPDTLPAALVFTHVNADNKKGSGHGALEWTSSPGTVTTSFTQQDINEGKVSYAHRGERAEAEASTARIALQVSDGIETSATAFLRVSAFPLQLRLVNNTGVVLTHRAAVTILPANLTFLTNADDPDLEVLYEVVRPPQYGNLQRARAADGSAAVVSAKGPGIDRFTSRQLAREQIRYVHATGQPAHDEFKFKVSVGEVRAPTTYDFRVTFTKLRLEQARRVDLKLNRSREALVTERHLLYRTEPLATDAAKVVYHVVQVPRHGSLVLGLPGAPQQRQQQRLAPGDSFTQQDVKEGRLTYRLHRTAYSRIRDEFTFRASAPDCEAIPGSLVVLHETAGGEVPGLAVTLERLQVAEGGASRLTTAALRLAMTGVTSVRYAVTSGPSHGWLKVSAPTLRLNATEFTSAELAAGQVEYSHDDSESQHDAFHFVAMSSEAEDFMYAGTLHIDVVLKNDNAPVRAVDRVFRVVTGGERLLTGRHLKYTDADLDASPEKITYRRRDIPNGGLYRASQPGVAVTEFTQKDLDDGRLLFRHHGAERGRVDLWVTDGQFVANGVLEVVASPPYVEVANNSRLLVRNGGAAQFSTSNLSADSNVNSLPEHLRFEVLEGPGHGRLFLRDPGVGAGATAAAGAAGAGRPQQAAQQAVHFTQRDLEAGRLWYQHDASDSFSDAFRFRVDVPGSTVEGRFEVRVFPSSYWEPFTVHANETITVEEATSVAVTSRFLDVRQRHVPATDITFVVVEPPQFGYLEIESQAQATSTEDPRALLPQQPGQASVTVFEQSLVNEGRVLYVQTAPNQTQDRVVVDVTNGISWMRGLVVRLAIIPDSLYLATGELRVSENSLVALPANILTVLTDYYRSRITEYVVVSPPAAGRMQHAREPGQAITKFSPQQLQAGLIQYQHDGSETQEDAFSVSAVAGDRSSTPARIRVVVAPVNDQPPKVVNSSSVHLWRGASAPIFTTNLAVVDSDTSPHNVSFKVMSIRAGHIAFANTPAVPITKFTQADINSNNIIFVHSGVPESGRVELRASDGMKETEAISLEVQSEQPDFKVAANEVLHVFPMLRKCITAEHLMVVTTDPNRNLTYSVRVPPTQGRLLLISERVGEAASSVSGGRGSSGREVLNFTQRDVNMSRLCYQHTSPFKDLQANDSIEFDVTAPFIDTLTNQVFRIEVSVSSGGLDQFVSVSQLIVEEGGTAPLLLNTSTVLDFLRRDVGIENPLIQVQVVLPPVHGALCVRTVCNATATTPFTSAQLGAGEVVYRHDHSDTTWDEVALSLLLAPGDVLLGNVSIPVTVLPVNDQPFRLAEPSPHLAVVQGQAAPVTRKQLLTEDADTRAEELVYDVISNPSQGRLVLDAAPPAAGAQTTAAPGAVVSVGRFSQADIDESRLWYVHDGPLQPDSFYFRVSDGKFAPVYTVFNIEVLPLTLNVSVRAALRLQQGSNVAALSADNFLVSTNGRRDAVQYNVTRAPRHGAVFLSAARDRPAASFSQADVEAGRVLYMQTDMTASSDAMELSAWVPSRPASVPALVLNVTVVPLVRLGLFSPIAGLKTRLDLSALDASQLAKVTGSDPVYRVLRRPRFGKIRRIVRSSGSSSGEQQQRNGTAPTAAPGASPAVREREVERFSHQELRAGLIYYVGKRTGQPGDEDSILFELAASIFQPASGELRFLLRSEFGPPPTAFVPQRPRIPGPKGSYGVLGSDTVVVASPNMSNDYFLLVSMVAGVVVLALIVVVVIKCRAGSVQGLHDGQNGKSDITDRSLGPMPLPRPPDDLMPSSPRPKHFGVPSLSLASTPTSMPVPQCKVIPLGPTGGIGVDSVTSSEPELNVNLRYPYGADDTPLPLPLPQEWGSTFDATAGLAPSPSDISFGTLPSQAQARASANNPLLRRNQYWV
ncbi:chondroitin sulfate proteoglycan 4 isoform X2 [Frankliniella occidentalis]|uniref:Chondroitin sulfate proteoglycan 4 isoform X2 n=1 Tax=Frankliniella occidentalis TaxID=133901 RepID=A0A9C6U222_FRAOC|nr:chondroitin sulfate proteoglycan 4 isoform X2 [Frankliniella occidentalis]